VEIQWRFRIFS